MKLRDIAHSRTGDKGNVSNISLIAYEEKYYELIKEEITPQVVKEWFCDMFHGEVVRYELPGLLAFNFVIYDALGGGVTRSLSMDTHGKSLSSHLLDIEIKQRG